METETHITGHKCQNDKIDCVHDDSVAMALVHDLVEIVSSEGAMIVLADKKSCCSKSRNVLTNELLPVGYEGIPKLG